MPADARDDFRAHLGERGIDTGVHWQPGHHFKLLETCRMGDLAVSDRAGNEIVTLPLHSAMADADAQAVVEAVTGYFSGGRAEAGDADTALEQIAAAG